MKKQMNKTDEKVNQDNLDLKKLRKQIQVKTKILNKVVKSESEIEELKSFFDKKQ